MRKFTIVFKSGAKVDVMAEYAKTTYSTLTGELTGYSFTGVPDGAPLYLNVNEVAGIFQNQPPGEEEEDHA